MTTTKAANRVATQVPEPDVPSILNAIYAFEVTNHDAWLEGIVAAVEECVPHAMRAHSSLLRWRGVEPPELVALAPHGHMTPEVRASFDPGFMSAVLSLGKVNLAAPVLAEGHWGSLPQFVKAGL